MKISIPLYEGVAASFDATKSKDVIVTMLKSLVSQHKGGTTLSEVDTEILSDNKGFELTLESKSKDAPIKLHANCYRRPKSFEIHIVLDIHSGFPLNEANYETQELFTYKTVTPPDIQKLANTVSNKLMKSELGKRLVNGGSSSLSTEKLKAKLKAFASSKYFMQAVNGGIGLGVKPARLSDFKVSVSVSELDGFNFGYITAKPKAKGKTGMRGFSLRIFDKHTWVGIKCPKGEVKDTIPIGYDSDNGDITHIMDSECVHGKLSKVREFINSF